MPPAHPASLIAPLSLCNVLTVVCALICLWTVFRQEAQTRATGPTDLAVPAALAAAVALMLLAGVFDATLRNDLEWVAAAAAGILIGHVGARSVRLQIDEEGSIRLPRSIASLTMATALVALSVIDFASAARETPLIAPQHVAALAAFCAGYLGRRVYILGRRVQRGRSPAVAEQSHRQDRRASSSDGITHELSRVSGMSPPPSRDGGPPVPA